MKIKNICHILGWIDHDNQYHLDKNLLSCFNKDDIGYAVIDNIDGINNAKSVFVLESVKEKSIRPGHKYYYLYDTFGAGLRDAPLHICKKSYVNKNIFTSETKDKTKKLFNFYWDIDDRDELCLDSRCCFKIVLVKLTVKKSVVMIPQTEYTIDIK